MRVYVMRFNKFVAVDWSGAKGPRLKGLKVAICGPGKDVPVLVNPTGNWRRSDLAQWIKRTIIDSGPVLFGFDFAFSYPYCDLEEYFPGSNQSPERAKYLWQDVDRICMGVNEFYGGPFYKSRLAPFAEYLCYQDYTGINYSGNRYRLTESICYGKYGTKPTCDFKCVGPDAVGIGSIAGMRFLHHFNELGSLAIWPFQSVHNNQSVFVEIFPRLYLVQAKQNPKEWSKLTVLNSVLTNYDSAPLPNGLESEDEVDAIISSAALRRFASNEACWKPDEMSDYARYYEGWIFGV